MGKKAVIIGTTALIGVAFLKAADQGLLSYVDKNQALNSTPTDPNYLIERTEQMKRKIDHITDDGRITSEERASMRGDFFQSIEDAETGIVRMLIDSGIFNVNDVKLKDKMWGGSYRYSAIEAAVSSGSSEMLEMFLNTEGVNIFTKSVDLYAVERKPIEMFNLLEMAINSGNIENLKLLIAVEGAVEAWGTDAFSEAAKLHNLIALQILYGTGKINIGESTALIQAMGVTHDSMDNEDEIKNFYEVIDFLLSLDHINVNATDKYDRTAISFIPQLINGNIFERFREQTVVENIVGKLLAKGASVDQETLRIIGERLGKSSELYTTLQNAYKEQSKRSISNTPKPD